MKSFKEFLNEFGPMGGTPERDRRGSSSRNRALGSSGQSKRSNKSDSNKVSFIDDDEYIKNAEISAEKHNVDIEWGEKLPGGEIKLFVYGPKKARIDFLVSMGWNRFDIR